MTEVHPETSNEAYFRTLGQGSILHRDATNAVAFDVFGEECEVVAVVSQTCDVVLTKRPTILLAPVVELFGDDHRKARRRDNPRYVHLPGHGEIYFADLARIHAIEKPRLVGTAITAGVAPDDDGAVRDFSLAIGRWFSRFAFPDEIVPWLRPLLSVIREKYSKSQSPLGRILEDVVEIRVEARQWATFPIDLVLHVIVKAGAVPSIEEESLGTIPENALGKDGNVVAPTALAELIVNADSSATQAALWPLLAESLARICQPAAKDLANPRVADALSGAIVGEFWQDDEFPLSKYRKSELLDVDYLSAAHPL